MVLRACCADVRRILVLLALLAVGCGTAAAAVQDREQHAFTAGDQAAARSAVLKKTDFGAGWTGGAKKPDLSPSPPCASYDPKQSDLVLTGAAESVWKHAGLELDTEAQVLKTAAMVKLDWQRTVLDPRAIACLKAQLQKHFNGSVKFVSFRRVSFPRLGTYSRAYVTLLDVTSSSGTVRVASEDVLIGRKRTELTLTSTTAQVTQAAVHSVDVRLAKILLARAKA
jgi:hypothetical protein